MLGGLLVESQVALDWFLPTPPHPSKIFHVSHAWALRNHRLGKMACGWLYIPHTHHLRPGFGGKSSVSSAIQAWKMPSTSWLFSPPGTLFSGWKPSVSSASLRSGKCWVTSISSFFFFFLYPWLSWSLLCRSGYPSTQEIPLPLPTQCWGWRCVPPTPDSFF